MNFKRAKKWFNKRSGAKKLDIEKSIEAFKEDFRVYWPDPTVDLDKYTDDNGDVIVDQIPADQLIEFTCRYLTPDEFDRACAADNKVNIADLVDMKKFHKLSKEEIDKQADDLNEKLSSAILEAMSKEKSDLEVAYETVFYSCVDPQFESIDQLKRILPLGIINMIAEESIKFTNGQNLMTREQS